MKIYGIVGWKNSGKTRLVERLVTHFVQKGIKVSTIKHAHHDFDIDTKGRDSYRHRDAGAYEVLVSSGNRFALMREFREEAEPKLDELLSRLAPVDLVIIEGFKTMRHPKIEAHRWETGKPLLASSDPMVRAVASNTEPTTDRPVFALDDIESISAFIRKETGV